MILSTFSWQEWDGPALTGTIEEDAERHRTHTRGRYDRRENRSSIRLAGTTIASVRRE